MWDDALTPCVCGCGRLVAQSMAEGRRRLYATGACRQRAYRSRLRLCVVCGSVALPLRPKSSARYVCASCGSVLEFDGLWRVVS